MEYVSNGPVGTLPGNVKRVSGDSVCDECENKALYRVQGETDSFGCEYLYMCEDHYQEHLKCEEEYKDKPQYCEWCHSEKEDVCPFRDMDEGMAGPVYDVCPDCRIRHMQRYNDY